MLPCVMGVFAQRLGPLPKQWIGVRKGIRPIISRSTKPSMDRTNKHGHQPARRLGWAAPAYQKKDGANNHPGPRRRRLLYDGEKPDKRFGVRVGSWNVGSLRGKGVEICEELRKRRVDVCCVQEVRWRGEGARMMGVEGRKYKLWWKGNNDGVGGVGVLVKEELCEKVVEVRRRNDRVMTIVMVFEEEVVRLICGYAPQSGRTREEKECFYDELAGELDVHSEGELVLCVGDFNGHVGKRFDGFEGVHGGNGFGERNLEGRMLLEFCDEKELCVANTWFRKEDKRKVTFSSGGNETEIDFVLVDKEKRKFLKDIKVFPGELQHRLVVVDVDKRKVKKVVRKVALERRNVWKLKEEETRKKFEARVGELVETDASDLWGCYKEGLLQACDEICGKKKGRRDRRDTGWWNEEVKEAIARKKEAYKEMRKNGTEESKVKYKRLKKQAKKVVAKAMKKETEKGMSELKENPNSVYKIVKAMKKDGRDVAGGRCMRGSDGKLNFSERDRGKVWKEHMEKIMNEENEWDQEVEADLVEGPVERVSREEVVRAIREMSTGKAAGPSEVSVEMIIASGEIGIGVMMELCQRVLDGRGMPEEWEVSVVVPIFKGKGDARSCGAYRGVKLLEHAMKIVERVLVNRIRRIVEVDEMQFGFMPGKGTIDAVFILRRLQEEYRAKGKKLYMCFVDLEKAFDRVPRKVMEWAMRKRGIPEAMVRAVMSLYEGAKTRVRVGSELSEEFEVKVGVHQGSVLSPLVFAIVIDVVTESAREGLMGEMLYADDLVLMSDTMEGLREKFVKWREAFESKGLKVNLGKTKVMVSGMEGKALMSKVDPCGMCGKRVKANSVWCQKCGKWIHGRCTKMKRVTQSLAKDFVCGRCEKGVGGVVEQEEKLCDEVESVKEFTYLGDKVSVGGGCEAAVTARARFGWVKFRECGELLCGKRFPLKMKGMVYKSCVRSVMLYGSETWCLSENEMGILRRAERAMVRVMCGVKLMDRKKTEDLMQMLGLQEAVERLAKANGVRWYGHVLRRDDGHVLRRALEFEVSGPRKRGRPKKTWKMQVEEESKRVGMGMRDALNRVKWREGVRAIATSLR